MLGLINILLERVNVRCQQQLNDVIAYAVHDAFLVYLRRCCCLIVI